MVGPAVFRAAAESSSVTGQTFYVDGGWTVQGRGPESNVKKATRKNR
jgi:enoyl-[acyl-carrier-protein] reductase (NADH)